MDTTPSYPTLRIVSHPLVQHKLSILRDRETPTKIFKELVDEIAMLMAYEATSDLALEESVKRGGGTDARVQTSLGVVNLLAGNLQGAEAALIAARPLFGNRPPTPAWFHYAGLAAALLGDARLPQRAGSRRAGRALPSPGSIRMPGSTGCSAPKKMTCCVRPSRRVRPAGSTCVGRFQRTRCSTGP